MTEPLTLAQRLRDYRLTLEENVVICDRSAVDEAANRIEELENDLRIGMANFDAAEAKLAKVEAERDEAEVAKTRWFRTHLAHRDACDALGKANGELLKRAMESERRADHLSAELAEARKQIERAGEDLHAVDTQIEHCSFSLARGVISQALIRIRSFLASKEASHE